MVLRLEDIEWMSLAEADDALDELIRELVGNFHGPRGVSGVELAGALMLVRKLFDGVFRVDFDDPAVKAEMEAQRRLKE